MNKIVSIKNTNAIFLATVLVIGIIALSSPSFIIGVNAQGEPYYGMENNHKKSYGKDVSVNPIKCNNINVNLNGFNGLKLNVLPTSLNALATDEAQAADEGRESSSFGNGERNNNGYQHNDKDFRFVCINNNNFEVVEDETTPTEPLTCEECFHKFLIQEQINVFLAFKSFDNLAELCFDLDKGETEEARFIEDLGDALDIPEETAQNLIECLKSVGIIFT